MKKIHEVLESIANFISRFFGNEDSNKKNPILPSINTTTTTTTTATVSPNKGISKQKNETAKTQTLSHKKPKSKIVEKEKNKQDSEGYKKVEYNIKDEPNFNKNYFPIIIYPEKGTLIKPPQKGRSGHKGVTEDCFYSYLERYFGKNNEYKASDSMTLCIRQKGYQLEPDFSVINERNGVYIDVEIDEPYSAIGNPIHFHDSDLRRNIEFVSKGWIVIRFSEEQIHKHPESCIKEIVKTIKNIDDSYEYPSELNDIPNLARAKVWTYEEAMKKIEKNEREKYLGRKIGISPEKERIAIEDEYTDFDDTKTKELLENHKERIEKVEKVNHSNKNSKIGGSTKTNNTEPRRVINQNQIKIAVIPEENSPEIKQSLVDKKNIINANTAKTDEKGHINNEFGEKNKPHRFHFNNKKYYQKYFDSCSKPFIIANLQKNMIEKKYDFLKCTLVNNDLICRGTIKMEDTDTYDITIVYRENKYPYVIIEAQEHDITPSPEIHMYDDKSLCLFYTDDHCWKPQKLLSDTIIPWISEWIVFYELYRIESVWYGKESPYHIGKENKLDY